MRTTSLLPDARLSRTARGPVSGDAGPQRRTKKLSKHGANSVTYGIRTPHPLPNARPQRRTDGSRNAEAKTATELRQIVRRVKALKCSLTLFPSGLFYFKFNAAPPRRPPRADPGGRNTKSLSFRADSKRSQTEIDDCDSLEGYNISISKRSTRSTQHRAGVCSRPLPHSARYGFIERHPALARNAQRP